MAFGAQWFRRGTLGETTKKRSCWRDLHTPTLFGLWYLRICLFCLSGFSGSSLETSAFELNIVCYGAHALWIPCHVKCRSLWLLIVDSFRINHTCSFPYTFNILFDIHTRCLDQIHTTFALFQSLPYSPITLLFPPNLFPCVSSLPLFLSL